MKPWTRMAVLIVALAAIAGGPDPAHAEGVFSAAYLGAGNSDAVIGLDTNKTYVNAVNLNGGAAGVLLINNVAFTNSLGANPSGPGWSFSGVANTYGTGGTDVNPAGQLGQLTDVFIYGGNPGVHTLSGLSVGETYVLTYYNRSWEAAGNRRQNVTSTVDNAAILFDEDMGASAQGHANLLRHTFTATAASYPFRFAPVVVANTMHLYGFTTERMFDNAWTGGTDWPAATWSKRTPAGRGASASFPAQGVATQVGLEVAATLGHLQFAGASPWTLAGSGILSLHADAGGVSVLAASNGTHAIAVTVAPSNDVVKLGDGALALSGIMSGTNNFLVNMGALVVSNRNALAGPTVQIGGGALRFGAGITNASLGGLAGRSNVVLQTLDASPLPVELSVGMNGVPTTYGGVLSGPGRLAKTGTGTLTLSNQNLQTGGTRVGGGTLVLDYTANNGPLLPAAGVLTLAGGTLQLDRASSASGTYAQPVASTTLDSGASQITRGTGSSAILHLGTITRASDGLLDVAAAGIATVNNPNQGGILGAWATVGGVDWAVNSTGGANGPIIAFSAYSDLQLGGTISDGSANLRLVTGGSGSVTMAAPGVTDMNTLKHVESASSILDIGAGNTLRVGAAGGVLVPSGSGALNLTSGTLTAGGADNTAGDLAIVNQSVNLVTIGSAVSDNGSGAVSLTKGGSGTLSLTSANSFSGGTFIDAGTLQVGQIGALGGGAVTVGHGAALQISASGTLANELRLAGAEQSLLVDNGLTPILTGRIWNTDGSGGSLTIDGIAAGTRSHTLILSNAVSLGAKSLRVQGPIANGDAQAVAQRTVLTNATLTTAGDVQVGRATLVFAGSTVANIDGKLGAQYNNTGDWATVILQDSAVVTAVGGVDRNANVAWGLNLNGGELRVPGIDGDDYSGVRRVNLNGGRLTALASTPNFIRITGGAGAAYVLGGGAHIDTASNAVTIAVPLLTGGGTDGGLTKYGGGTLVLSGANTFNGGLTLLGGTLQAGHASALGAGGGPLSLHGGTLDLRGYGFAVGSLNGSSGLITDHGAASGSPTMLVVTQSAYGVFSGTFADGAGGQAVGLVKAGAAILTLAGTNAHAYSGPTIVSEGTLRLSPVTAAPVGAVAHYDFDGTLTDATGRGLDGTLEGVGAGYAAARPGTFGQSFNFAGGQAVAVAYSGYLALNNFTISSWVNLNATPGTYGILGTRFGGENTFDLKVQSLIVHGDVGSGSGWINTAVDFNYTMPVGEWHMVTYSVDGTARQVRMYLDGALRNTVALGGTSAPLLMKAGQTLKIGDSYTTEYMNGRIDDVYVFGSALSGERISELLRAGENGVSTNLLPTAAIPALRSGATLDLGGVVQTFAGLSDYIAGGGIVTNGRARDIVLTLRTPAGTNITFGGTIADGGTGRQIALYKDGAGTQTLSGASTYIGGTTIGAGVMLVDSTTGSGTGTGDVVVVAGATLGGTGTVAGAVIVQSGGRLAPGSSVGTNTVGSLVLTNGAIFEVEADGDAADQTISLGAVDLGGATLSTVALTAPTFTSALIISNAAGQITGQFAGLHEADQVLVGGVPYFIHYRATYVELNLTPTAVVLHQFGAMAEGADVVVRWRTASEVGTAGFFVFRRANGEWVKLNDAMIAATGAPQGGMGASYALADPGAAAGGTFEYKLVEVVQDGSSNEYGPYERTATEFRMESPVRPVEGGMEVRWLSRAGERYRVLASDDLGGGFRPLAEGVEPTPPENAWLDPAPGRLRVYRIELEP